MGLVNKYCGVYKISKKYIKRKNKKKIFILKASKKFGQ